MARPRLLLELVLVSALMLVAAASEAGIVVLDSGRVIRGTLHADEVTQDRLLLHDPEGTQGLQTFERSRVRWFDVDADTLTDAYFAAHRDAPLVGLRWLELREKWIAAQEAEDPSIDPTFILPGEALEPLATHGDGFSIRRPLGWGIEFKADEGILVLRAPQQGHGFAARIHVFVTPASDEADPAGQVDWIRQELASLDPAARFEVVEQSRLKQVAGGTNQRLLTETALPERTVQALRQVCFRAERTVFFTAYGDRRAFPRLAPLVEASLETLRLREDE